MPGGISRRETNLADAEITPFTHRYLLRKPRSHESDETNINPQPEREDEGGIDDPAVEKRRFELFIDLIWVGIIGNLAESFSEQAFNLETGVRIGRATFDFVVLFLIAWRFWVALQEFMGKYRTNDLVEKLFVLWALVLAMLFGNNAPFLFDEEHQSNLAMGFYLIFRFSLFMVEALYSLFLPQIRRRVMLQGFLTLPFLSLWLTAFWMPYHRKAQLVMIAISVEYWLAMFLDSPWAHRFIKDDRKEIFNTDHWIERIQDFFIIIVGEGVLSLIRGSPLGMGLTTHSTCGIYALFTYYIISFFYFNGDQSRKYVHAVKRVWYRKAFWLFFHHVLFASTVILGVTAVFLIQHAENNAEIEDAANEEEVRLATAIYSAKWAFSTALSHVLVCQTGIALLSRSLDRKGSLKVDNRYLRLLPRVLIVPIALCIAVPRNLGPIAYTGILLSLLLPTLIWEWFASLESGGGILERSH